MGAPAVEERDWSPLRSAAAATDYVHLRLGPLALGPPRWKTSVGQAHLALAESDDEIVVVDRMTSLRNHPDVDADDLMADVRHVMGLRHRHVMKVIGAGIDNDVPYLVRRFRLGRPLSEILDVGRLDRPLAVALLYPIAEAVGFLAEEGPKPGICSVGGFDPRDVWVSFDGGVWLTGHGSRRLRHDEDGDPIQQDLSSLLRLATVIGRATRTNVRELLDDVTDLDTAQAILRRTDREACGRRAEILGAWMRAFYDDAILAERAEFGLDTLH